MGALVVRPPSGVAVPARPSSSGVVTAQNNFLADAAARFGQMLPVAAPPKSSKLICLPYSCSLTGKQGVATFGQDYAEQRYHLKANTRPYASVLEAGGVLLENPGQKSLHPSELDWCAFQCEHCGAGLSGNGLHNRKITLLDWWCCGQHKGLLCGYMIEDAFDGGRKAFCPICDRWAMLERGFSDAVDCFYYEASAGNHQPDSAPAAGRGATPALIAAAPAGNGQAVSPFLRPNPWG
jgi:hypothetical protein